MKKSKAETSLHGTPDDGTSGGLKSTQKVQKVQKRRRKRVVVRPGKTIRYGHGGKPQGKRQILASLPRGERRAEREVPYESIRPVARKQWTPGRLSKVSGLHLSDITRVFNGNSKHQRWLGAAYRFRRLAAAMGVTVDELVGIIIGE